MEDDRVKMCPFCEGEVPRHTAECPFCGSNLAKLNEPPKDDLTHLYQPPYIANNNQHFGIPNTYEDSFAPDPVTKEAVLEKPKKPDWVPLSLLTIGSYLMVLGLFIFFFSENGKLILEWSSKYCLLYTLGSLPFLYLGWKNLS